MSADRPHGSLAETADEVETTNDGPWLLPDPIEDWVPPSIDTNQPSSARVYDYALGGTNNFPVDRATFERISSIYPAYREWAVSNRAFMTRAVQFMATEGIDQFVDLGTGLPTWPAVHDVAREITPDARVVYVDNDPIVMAHSRAMLARFGGVITIEADLREPNQVLNDPLVRETISFDRPVGLLFVAVLHFVKQEPALRLLSRYLPRLAPGSMVAISVATLPPQDETMSDEDLERAAAIAAAMSMQMTLRTAEQTVELFGGLDVVDPGVARMGLWRAQPDDPQAAADIWGLAGVGRVR